MFKDQLLNLIKSYPDFPQKGIVFKDITPIFRDTEIFKNLISEIADSPNFINSDAIVAIDARGFIFASALALRLNKPFVLARKPGKLPGKLMSKSYDLEYSSNTLSIQEESIIQFNSFVIVDDLLATGGTVECIVNLLEGAGKKINGLEVVIELEKLQGRTKFDFPVNSQLVI